MAAISEVIPLRLGRLSLGLVPRIGGSVAYFRLDDIDLMRPLSDADRAADNVLGVAMFPMLPYANRIAGNQFTFRGTTWHVTANNPPERFNVHGTGWHRPWSVRSSSATEAILDLEVANSGSAYAYRASQTFALTANSLDVHLQVQNIGPVAMPFGFGLHPWFERDRDTQLQFSAARFYLEEPEGVAGDAITLPPELDFAQSRPLPARWRNNDYGGWAGHARIAYPGRGVTLELHADPIFGHLMIYADPTKPYFCVEPQSNASGAFNRSANEGDESEGIIVLRPGESCHGRISFAVDLL